MCGRFTLRARPEDVARAAGADLGGLPFRPRFNIAPSQDVLAFRAGGAAQLRWGLIPSWAKDPTIGNRMINARAETLAEKPAFRRPFRQHRCVVAADGFYEWRKPDSVRGAKTPWFIRLAGDVPFGVAALWDAWRGPDATVESCTIVTTAANRLVAPIHDRMPVILTGDAIRRWIATPPEVAEELRDVLAPYPAEAMAADPVSNRVNRPANDDAACLAPPGRAPGRLL
jgi:putative SOS response-associated peptidase YedK